MDEGGGSEAGGRNIRAGKGEREVGYIGAKDCRRAVAGAIAGARAVGGHGRKEI